MEWPIPPRAQAMLRHFLDVRQDAEDNLAQAVRLVLAAVGAPEDAKVVVFQDGAMCVRSQSDNNALSDESEPPIREG
jgi:hypothetical protein